MDAALRLPQAGLQRDSRSQVLAQGLPRHIRFRAPPLTAQITAGNLHDVEIFPPLSLFRRGTLFLFDKGFVAYARLRTIAQAGHHYLCPMRLNGNALVTRVNRGPAWLRKAVKNSRDGVLRDVLPQRKRIGRVFDLEFRLRPKARRADKRVVCARLVIAPGPEREQRPYLTSLSAEHWVPAFLRETYRLRWQVELVFKELKQNLSLEVLPSKDRYAVQIFAWASLIAPLSQSLSAWIWPLHRHPASTRRQSHTPRLAVADSRLPRRSSPRMTRSSASRLYLGASASKRACPRRLSRSALFARSRGTSPPARRASLPTRSRYRYPAYRYVRPLSARGDSSFRVPTCRHRTKGYTQRPTMSAAVAP